MDNKSNLEDGNYIETLQNDARKRYKAKLHLISADVCPYQVPGEQWLDDPTSWPSLSYHDLYHYLIKTPSKFV